MVVRIRFRAGPKVSRVKVSQEHGQNRQIALVVAAMMTPATVLASVLAFWRVAADMKLTNSFAIPSGLFSHWQVWLGAAVLLQLCSRLLNRYGRGRDTATS